MNNNEETKNDTFEVGDFVCAWYNSQFFIFKIAEKNPDYFNDIRNYAVENYGIRKSLQKDVYGCIRIMKLDSIPSSRIIEHEYPKTGKIHLIYGKHLIHAQEWLDHQMMELEEKRSNILKLSDKLFDLKNNNNKQNDT